MGKTAATSDHDSSHSASASICDQLFEALGQRVPRVKRTKTQGWCCFFPEAQRRFAYVKHRKKRPGVEVWFHGQGDASPHPLLDIRERKPTSPGGFAKNFRARFAVDDSKQVQSAALLLASTTVSDSPSRDRAIFPDEVPESSLREGAVCSVTVNAYERNAMARRLCILHYGYTCVVCGFNFAQAYGEVGEGVIHVHHLCSLSEIREDYSVDPVKDLRPVCPNCHAIIHCRNRAYTIEEVRAFLRSRKTLG